VPDEGSVPDEEFYLDVGGTGRVAKTGDAPNTPGDTPLLPACKFLRFKYLRHAVACKIFITKGLCPNYSFITS
jgi:hypothetical protein